MDWIRGLTSTLDDPRMLHAAVVHYPIAASLVGVALVAAYLVALRFRPALRHPLRLAILFDYATLALAAWIATESGEDARAALGAASEEARALIERHRELAEKVAGLALLTLLAVAATGRSSSPGAGRLDVLLHLTASGSALCGALVVAMVGHLGGTAVYRHGAGVPRLAPTAVETSTDPRVVQYLSQVRPVLERSCVGCHGPGRYAAGGLDLTGAAGAVAGGGRGPAVVPGDPDGSLLLQAASWTHPTLRMPMGGSRLDDGELGALRDWIAAGAVGAPEEAR